MKTIYTTFIILLLFGLKSNAQWTLTTTDPATGPIQTLTSDGTNLFGGSSCSAGYGNIFLTPDNGNTWTSTVSGIPSFQYVSFISFQDSTVFSGEAVGGSNTGLGVYKTTNSGASWSQSMLNGLAKIT